MIRHRRIRLLLSDYLAGDLSQRQMARVEEHLARCADCRSRFAQLGDVADLLRERAAQPGEERTQEFWEQFADRIETAIGRERPERRWDPFRALDPLIDVILIRWRPVAAGATVLAVAVAVIVHLRTASPPQTFTASAPDTLSAPNPVDERMSRYFEQSKVLLVGLTNLPPEEHDLTALSLERQTSRQLVQEARFLKRQHIDQNSAELIGDLEKIMIELSTIDQRNGARELEMIRGGIHQNNLLFKVRMAETYYGSTRPITMVRHYEDR